MPNLDLDKKEIPLTDDRVKKALKKDKISGNNLTTTISRLEKSIKENPNEEKQYVLNYLKGLVKRERDGIKGPKDIAMKTGGPGTKKDITGGLNNHFKNRTKDNKVDMSSNKELKTTRLDGKGQDGKTNQNKKIAYYESYSEEIQAMRYLIEYMNNKKTKI